MYSNMPAAVWRRGSVNALFFALCLIALTCAVAATVALAFNRQFGDCIRIGLEIVAYAAMLAFFVNWVRDKPTAGDVLLDCGRNPMSALFGIAGIAFLVMAIGGGITAIRSHPAQAYDKPIFNLLFATFWLVLASGRLQIRQNGIWNQSGLLRWNKIRWYGWAAGPTLLVRTTGPFSFLQLAISVPAEQKETFERILAEHTRPENT